MSIGLTVRAAVRLPTFTLDAAFAVPPGLTVLFGPSGAGKSLALQTVAGLAPLHAGQIVLSQLVLADAEARLSLPPRLRHVGYVPQQYALFPHLSVAENVAYALPRPRHPWDRETKAAREAQVRALLDLVRLPGFGARWPRELSGGQAQRVALARALAAEPRALLLDEPLSALDAPTRSAVRDDLRAIILAGGLPSLVVTHDLSEARALADRLVVLIAGRVVAEGPVAPVLTAPPSGDCALLFGWRNVLPVARLEHGPGTTAVTLTCGQTLQLTQDEWSDCEGHSYALALHADRLEVEHHTHEHHRPKQDAGRYVSGTLARVDDAGSFMVLVIDLARRDSATEGLEVTLSPREWSALGIAPGDAVIVRVPAGAARLLLSRTTMSGERDDASI